MCALLAQLYPEQAAAVAAVIREEVKSEGGEQLWRGSRNQSLK
jgi:hypothetical protein